MKLIFAGADKEVTGSCHLLEVDKYKILLDCGMFQGGNFNEGKNYDKFPFVAKEIDVLLVSHAHLDHVGRIPKLIKEGFRGKIYMTKATKELAQLIWTDAWHIMKENNRRYKTPILFSQEDISQTYEQCIGIDYHQEIEVVKGVKAVWKDAGHIYGSSFIQLVIDKQYSKDNKNKKIVFSGDIGNEDVPILKDTENLDNDVDLLLCESTYGDRIHESVDVRRSVILDLIKKGVARGGTIMIPAFSLERTQELLYELNLLAEHDKTLPHVPFFLDSPLAINATKVYEEYPEYYDAEAMKLHLTGDDFLDFPGLKKTYDKEDSKKINSLPGAKIIIAGSGMMNGGRIIHHLFHHLSDPTSTLLIVGYQAQGTLGRRLYEGAKKVKIFHKEIPVKATIKALGALSAHGDQKKLLKWVGSGGKAPKQVFCVHGEIHAVTELSHRIRDEYNIETYIPEYGEEVEI